MLEIKSQFGEVSIVEILQMFETGIIEAGEARGLLFGKED